MALSDLLKGQTGKSVAIGLATAILAPLIVPILTQTARPLARSLIKAGILLYHRGRETVAEASETFDDLMAEVRAELAEEQRSQEEVAQQVAAMGEKSLASEENPPTSTG